MCGCFAAQWFGIVIFVASALLAFCSVLLARNLGRVKNLVALLAVVVVVIAAVNLFVIR